MSNARWAHQQARGRTAPGISERRNGSSRAYAAGDRGSSRRESARARHSPQRNTTFIVGAAAGAAVLLIVAIALASGPKRRVKTTPRPAPASPAVPASTIDWYTEGFNQGMHWKSVMSNRNKSPTPEEVDMVAERMTSNYTKKGITSEGERRFIEGFRRAALSQ